MRRLLLWIAIPLGCLGTIVVQLASAQVWMTQAGATAAAATNPASTRPARFRDVVFGNEVMTAQQLVQWEYWRDAVQELALMAVGFVPRIIVACVLFGIAYLIYRVLRKVIRSALNAAGIDESIRDMLVHLLKWIVLGFGVVIAGNQIGIQITALLTGVSIIGLAVGFAAQESISNFIAGVMIFLDKPFKVGDWINVDGHVAQVKRVTFRSTRLVDLDGDTVLFPNVAMLNRKLVNKSVNPVTRCNVPIEVPATSSISTVRAALLTLTSSDSRVEQRPEPELVVKAVTASTMHLMLHFWIREERYEDAMTFEYVERSHEALAQAGVR